ncbi:MAG: hypothetical protein M4579_006409 [Chaenotheca gracillima]|nr:MAG: hypothetical protein M4579_006409 [Chaenotheca gracillima]
MRRQERQPRLSWQLTSPSSVLCVKLSQVGSDRVLVVQRMITGLIMDGHSGHSIPSPNSTIFLVRPVAKCPKPELVKKFRDALRDDYQIVFMHGDFSWDHILVMKDTGQVTSIVDWEMAGWSPEYWEYNKSRHGRRTAPWWIELLHEIMPSYENQWRVDMDLSDFG